VSKAVSLLLLLIVVCAVPVGAAEFLMIDDFEHDISSMWRVNEFKGQTDYRVVTDGPTKVLQAVSDDSASALVYQEEFLLDDYPVISWRWKVAAVVEKGDASSKQTDDYAARIYIVFPHWFYPNTKSLNYIWANKLKKGSVVPSVYTGNSMMVAVESGSENVGSWQTVRRNIAEDFRQVFGTPPPEKWTIAIMTDTDNTGGKAKAWYDDIQLEKE
jgi:hypothetical protein